MIAKKKSKTRKWLHKPELTDVAAAILMIGSVFSLAHVAGELWSMYLEPVVGFEFHRLAFLVIFAALLNVTNIVPDRLKAGTKRFQTFISKHTIWILMAAVGLGTDVKGNYRCIVIR